MTSVTLEMRSTSPGSNLVAACPGAPLYYIWWGYIKHFLRYWAETILHVLHDLENETIFHMPTCWMPSVTLKFGSRSPSLNLVFFLLWCFSVPNLVRISQIFLQILCGYHISCRHLKWPLWPWKWSQGHLIRTPSSFALVLQCTEFGEDTSHISWDIARKPHFMPSP